MTRATIILVFAGAIAAWFVLNWVNGLFAPGAGGIWLALTVLLGGIVIRLRQARPAASCAVGPRLRPLQVSCFAVIALGVQLLQAGENAPLMTIFPFLAVSWLPAVFILGGMIGLAALSVLSDCRDAAFSGASLEEREHGAS
ncbi:MAG: hypothetical protein HXY39_15120 [Chloroflexi bacterium]|nr:hypothetical protein [Chloroflexota bacterium]